MLIQEHSFRSSTKSLVPVETDYDEESTLLSLCSD